MVRYRFVSLILAMILATGEAPGAGKSYSSGGGRSYSSGSRSSSSGVRSPSPVGRSSPSGSAGRISSPSPSTSGSKGKISGGSSTTGTSKSPSSGGRTYTSSSGKSYSSSSGTVASPTPIRNPQPRPTYSTHQGQTRPLGNNAPQADRLHGQLSSAAWKSRPQRQAQVYAPYAARPVVYYHDPYHPYFWLWLLERDRRQRAQWAYHHRHTMDEARFRELRARDPGLAAEISKLEAQGLPRDPTFVPKDEPLWRQRRLLGGLLAAGPMCPFHALVIFVLPEEPATLDQDLMFTDDFVTAAFNPAEAAESNLGRRSRSGFGGLWWILPIGLLLVCVGCVVSAFRTR